MPTDTIRPLSNLSEKINGIGYENYLKSKIIDIEFDIMEQISNIELFKITCSSIGKILIESKGLSKDEKIERLSADIEISKGKYNAMKDGLKSKENAGDRIALKEKELAILIEMPDKKELSQSVKKYCQDWFNSRLYDKKKVFTSKYTDKGNAVEWDSIMYLEEQLNWGLVTKNERRLYNDFMQGECDVLNGEYVRDIKNSWDFTTFPLYEDEIPNEDYYFQLQGYMELYGKKKAQLVYTLNDAPEEIILKEAFFKIGKDYSEDDYLEHRKNYIYSHYPIEMRAKIFDIEYDETVITRIKNRVLECREYIETLKLKVLKNNQQYKIKLDD